MDMDINTILNMLEEIKGLKEKNLKNVADYQVNLNNIKDEIIERNDKIDKIIAEVTTNINNFLKENENMSKGIWEPDDEEQYWSVDDDGTIEQYTFDMIDNISKWDFISGNCFKTKEEAEFRKFQIELEHKAKLFQEKYNDKKIDWNDCDQYKYTICYGFDENNIYINTYLTYYYKHPLGYFTSPDLAQKFKNENKEDLVKYFTGDK